MQEKAYTIDASGKILGRLAAEVAVLLQGKNKEDYLPNLLNKDIVKVFNTSQIKISGKKTDLKKYYRHSGYLGGIKEEKYKEMFERDPNEVFRRAVLGMLPKNKLRAKRIKQLKLYTGKII